MFGKSKKSASGSSGSAPAAATVKKERPWYIEIPIIILCALLVAVLFQVFIGRVYVIPSESMEPTLNGCTGCNNDRVFVNKLAYDFSSPKPGDVVVFRGPESWDEGEFGESTSDESSGFSKMLRTGASYIGLATPPENDVVKRVIATGGQTVECKPGDDGIKVDGKTIDSSYTLQPPQREVDTEHGSEACGGGYFGPITVPEGNVWLMGDNRTNSADSRYHMEDQYQGTVPEKNIIGRVDARILPFSRIGTVGHPDIQKD